jgi:microcystin degradation protein MlrC
MAEARKIRIAYARIAQETNAFSPVLSGLEGFEQLHFLEGDALEAATGRFGAEIKGMIRNAELSGFRKAVRRFGDTVPGGVEAIPLFSAWAMPAGPLTSDAFQTLRDRLVSELRAAAPDAVFLSLHGAMRGTAEMPEPEEEFLAAVREAVGPDVPVAVTLDLHAQLTPGKVDPATVLVTYRTNPHRDLASTGFRAGRILLATLAGQVRPVSRWRTLPMVMGGGYTIDFLRPLRGIFRHMRRLERDPRVLSTSLCMCHLFNDSPDLGWSVHVTTDDDPALAEKLADELAELAWGVREVPPPPFLSPEDGLAEVRRSKLARRLGTVCVVDVSDVVGAGGTGENTNLLKALLELGHGLRSYVPVLDAVAVEALWDSKIGDRAELEVGGRIDAELNPPVSVAGHLTARAQTEYFGRAVALDLGHVQLVITERPPLPLKPRFYKDLGLNPWRADLVVVKNFFHYRIYYAAVHRKSVAIRTRGLTDFERVLEHQTFNDAVYPSDSVSDWRVADRRRRGVVSSDLSGSRQGF